MAQASRRISALEEGREGGLGLGRLAGGQPAVLHVASRLRDVDVVIVVHVIPAVVPAHLALLKAAGGDLDFALAEEKVTLSARVPLDA